MTAPPADQWQRRQTSSLQMQFSYSYQEHLRPLSPLLRERLGEGELLIGLGDDVRRL
jgi:hypothetical protein